MIFPPSAGPISYLEGTFQFYRHYIELLRMIELPQFLLAQILVSCLCGSMVRADDSYFLELAEMGVDVTQLKGRLTNSELEGLVNGLHRLLRRRKHVAMADATAE